MQVFVSWSGTRSKALAEVLRDLLPQVLPNVKIWMSEHDVEAGSRWAMTLAERLAASDLGIACVTAENQASPWLIFEAGALSKRLDSSRFIPLLLEIDQAQITYPLAQFQLVTSDRLGLTKLCRSINQFESEPMDMNRIERQIEKWWPDFERGFKSAAMQGGPTPHVAHRSTNDILTEVLQQVRELAKARSASETLINKVWVNTQPFLGPEGRIYAVRDLHDLTVSDFLDEVWRELNCVVEVPAFTYGTLWTLHKVDGESLADLGKPYIQSRGKKRDNKSLGSQNIYPGDLLEVRRGDSEA